MSRDAKKESSYFFVPLGRERGGYLDVLDLPPDADPIAVATESKRYEDSIEKDFRELRRAVRQQMDSEQITEEEFTEQVGHYEADKTRRLAELGALRSKYEKNNSERRLLESEGRKYVVVRWMTMYQDPARISGAEESLIRTHPMPEFEPEVLHRVLERWLTSPCPLALLPATGEGRRCLENAVEQSRLSLKRAAERQQEYQRELKKEFQDRQSSIKGQVKRGELDKSEADAKVAGCQLELESEWRLYQKLKSEWAQANSLAASASDGARRESQPAPVKSEHCLASESVAGQADAGRNGDLAQIFKLVVEQELIGMLLADSLWSELRSTNREFWSNQVENWILESNDGMPKLRTTRVNPSESFEHPRLRLKTNLTIDKLQREELKEVARQPERRAQPPKQANWEAVLAAMRAMEKTGNSPDAGESDHQSNTPGRPMSVEDIVAFFEALSKK